MMKIVIIGGVAGGMSAATRLRRLNEDAEIIVLEKGPFVSFANCGLPYYVSGDIQERSDLLVQTPEQLRARFDLDVRPFSEAIAIDPDKKEVTVRSKEGDYQLAYDKVILSPGAKPFVPPAEGLSEAKNIFTMRNVPDVDAVTGFILEHKPKKAVVIGAGFIGLEMAESLAHRGLAVTIVEKAPHVLPPFDEEMAAYLADELKANGVTLYTGVAATAFQNEGKTIVLENGVTLDSDLTIMSVGVQPENSLAISAGIETGMRGGILVDENYETSKKDIYAVGDAIIVKQQITGEDTMIALASPANRQGRQVADVISGLNRKNKGSIGTAIVRVFGLAGASTGLNERQLQLSGKEFAVVHIQGKSHAGYYPNASAIVLKLIFHPKTGEIYGAQAIGADGVDKRIDIIATAIKGNLTVQDLPELEFTYAPPFGSAKDPVNMAGYAATNIIEGISESIQWYELEKMQEAGYQLLDVRGEGEIARLGALKGAINIPVDDLRARIGELSKETPIIVSCQSGLRSYIAERVLKQNGFTVKNLDGAFSLYATVRPEKVVK
ncbi:pyridine nucleotide disulphide reductase class-i signature [Trichococcus pasteurii]|uniref:Pyridine nucleotide disulphide reductase class-i signature n=2 Tax=Trichococcus pasteurii TaxID=43064 RepID=A0A1W1IE88_9LACT|nr:NADPH-dependent 2,4-dienoyl-CoA reductase, sulfur reductase [Trichococcus pasteurii]SLM51314.1 pyridine nucleotide disulphide reductase class-i signature [Trichococcus pasteurii]SSB92195.1 pyridine nucleotide disulphide reductase class-i signature [Trichococcus pasteurii]